MLGCMVVAETKPRPDSCKINILHITVTLTLITVFKILIFKIPTTLSYGFSLCTIW